MRIAEVKLCLRKIVNKTFNMTLVILDGLVYTEKSNFPKLKLNCGSEYCKETFNMIAFILDGLHFFTVKNLPGLYFSVVTVRTR